MVSFQATFPEATRNTVSLTDTDTTSFLPLLQQREAAACCCKDNWREEEGGATINKCRHKRMPGDDKICLQHLVETV